MITPGIADRLGLAKRERARIENLEAEASRELATLADKLRDARLASDQQAIELLQQQHYAAVQLHAKLSLELADAVEHQNETQTEYEQWLKRPRT